MPFVSLLIETAKRWQSDKASRLAAALAYYTIFSLAPLLIIVVQITALVLGGGHASGHHELAREAIRSHLQSVVGASASQAVIDLIDATLREQKQGIVAAAISWTVMILGAIGLVGALQDALNTVWHVEGPKRPGIAGLVRGRLAALALVAASAFVLLVSLVANVGLAALGDQLHGLFPASGALVNLLDFAVSFGVIALLFWVIFTYLPDAETKWRDTLHGAIISALLFVAGQFALGWYLGRVGTASAYGAAGSLVVILLWTFYSAQILLFGAEFTVVTASRARRSLAQSRRSASGRRSEPEAS